MSSILKALKKVEQQKSPRPHFELDVATGIVREKRSIRRSQWIIPAAMGAVALVAALATYGIMSVKQERTPAQQLAEQKPSPPAPPSAPAARTVPVSAPSPVVPAQTTLPIHPPAPITPAPTPAAARAQTSVAPKVRPSVPPATTSTPHPPATAASTPRNLPVAPLPPPSAATEAKREAAMGAAMPNLKVTGIAWQKDSASRLAIINGSAVSQGASIDGAKVEEILPDRVRFSVGQRNFEISLGKIQN